MPQERYQYIHLNHDYCHIYDGNFNGGNQWKVKNCRLSSSGFKARKSIVKSFLGLDQQTFI